MQQALVVTALFSTVTKYVCLRAGCRLGGSCPIPWSPAGSCLPRCSPGRVGIGLFLPAPENWSGRAAVPRWVSSSTAFVKPHPPQLSAQLLIRTAHYYYNELLASCVKFCQKLLTFFVSMLRKQIVTRAWLHSAIPRKAEQRVLGTGGMLLPPPAARVVDLAGSSNVEGFLTCNLCLMGNNRATQSRLVLRQPPRYSGTSRGETALTAHGARGGNAAAVGLRAPTPHHLRGLRVCLAATASASLLTAVFAWCPGARRGRCWTVFGAVI